MHRVADGMKWTEKKHNVTNGEVCIERCKEREREGTRAAYVPFRSIISSRKSNKSTTITKSLAIKHRRSTTTTTTNCIASHTNGALAGHNHAKWARATTQPGTRWKYSNNNYNKRALWEWKRILRIMPLLHRTHDKPVLSSLLVISAQTNNDRKVRMAQRLSWATNIKERSTISVTFCFHVVHFLRVRARAQPEPCEIMSAKRNRNWSPQYTHQTKHFHIHFLSEQSKKKCEKTKYFKKKISMRLRPHNWNSAKKFVQLSIVNSSSRPSCLFPFSIEKCLIWPCSKNERSVYVCFLHRTHAKDTKNMLQ